MSDSTRITWKEIVCHIVMIIVIGWAVMGPSDVAVAVDADHFISGFAGWQMICNAIDYSILTGVLLAVLALIIYTEINSVRKDTELAMIAVAPSLMMGSVMLAHAWAMGVMLGPIIGAILSAAVVTKLLVDDRKSKNAAN